MKISKLFHWLYAILMLLPFAFFVPSVLYYAFNDNATMQSVEVPKTETISVNFNQLINYEECFDEIVDRNGLTCIRQDNSFVVNGTSTDNTTFFMSNNGLYSNNLITFKENHKYLLKGNDGFGRVEGVNYYYVSWTLNGSLSNSESIISISNTTTSNGYCYINIFPNVTLVNKVFTPQIFDLTQMFGSGNEPTINQFNEWFPNSYYPYTESELMQITYDTGESDQLVENTSIINYAWESIWDLPLFSWCKVSFVAAPFTYITGLFGLAASNLFNYVFTYFASMSIIWLVFDVIMYVPLLVHRWLDKGIVE